MKITKEDAEKILQWSKTPMSETPEVTTEVVNKVTNVAVMRGKVVTETTITIKTVLTEYI
jgi:nitrogen regulatory protein PII-like uncharacterized protein